MVDDALKLEVWYKLAAVLYTGIINLSLKKRIKNG